MERLMATIESIMVDAGETCPDDYQSGFDWKKYNKAIRDVKDVVSTADFNQFGYNLRKTIDNRIKAGDETLKKLLYTNNTFNNILVILSYNNKEEEKISFIIDLIIKVCILNKI